MSSTGCSCGKYLLGDKILVLRPKGGGPGEVHRRSLACYREGGSKQVGLPLPLPGTLEGLQRRVEQLERVVSQLIGMEDG